MPSSIPQHIAIIMDGNGRWAKRRGLPRIEGHRRGVQVIRKILKHAKKLGVHQLTLYAFSTENWKRPSSEVALLMRLLKAYALKERANLIRDNVRMQTIGNLEAIPEVARREVVKTVEATKDCDGIILQLALNYSGRDELLRAFKSLAEKLERKEILLSDVSEQSIAELLDTKGQSEPDLVIRTSGEQRISNFMIWQTAYSEFYFTDCLWPDFDENEFDRAVESYRHRERRFGGISSLSNSLESRA